LNKQISVIGCGWLGLPLAKQLIKSNYKIKGSTTSRPKIDLLESHNIEGFTIKLSEKGIEGPIDECLNNSPVLILNIPPGLRHNPEHNFVKQMDLLISHIEKSSVKHILFISSTSVYPDDKSIPVITEKSDLNPDTESGKQLLAVEKRLQKNKNFRTTILRFSGLFGEDRHPAKFLAGKTNLKNPEGPVNLIHQKDCIQIIISIIEQHIWGDTFNASTTPHPTRKNYYTSQCEQLNLPIPEFDMRSITKGKLIDSTKLKQLLDYDFQIKL
jgi:nucleoside-diphosphate-sugar epimerase